MVELFDKDPLGPFPGDRFRVEGRQEILTVDVVERRARGSDGFAVWLVRTPGGARWSLRLLGTVVHDGVWFQGTALPADPEAPGWTSP